ncbi:DUF1501 domain-containing protein [Aliiglaciecola sp. SL4]|uniref:DUF1501 domain-containing protein n=1 Tax=Aliiglaciecola sp. SL4 TaxID=3239806 RepID=UPI00355B931A
MSMHRRDFIKAGMAGWIIAHTAVNGAFANAGAMAKNNKKLVWVMLRGAMDSLHGVMPLADPDFMNIRGPLVNPIENQLLNIDSGFALHPALKNCFKWYQNEQFLPVVAVASGYRKRSHFDGQDFMECGLNQVNYNSGWLARAVESMHGHGLAIAQTVPIALRGSPASQTWFPSYFTATDDDLIERMRFLYAENSEFLMMLEDAVKNRDMLAMNNKSRARANFSYLARHCGELLSRNDSANCAMLELNGWDTHSNQANRMDRQFDILDKGLAELKTGLAATWKNTVVMVTTEFGRTVAINGTKGTDHGTASAMFLLGGALKGKRVLGQWPGLSEQQRFAGRDLMPTSDVRSWIATVLQQHWGLSFDNLANVFPGIKPLSERLIKV